METELFKDGGVTLKEGKSVAKQVTISASSQLVVAATFKTFEKNAKQTLDDCEKISQVTNDAEYNLAREVGIKANELKLAINKSRLALNKPLKLKTDSNNEEAAKITEPIEKELVKLRKLITDYSQIKERKRLEEIKKVEDALLAKEEADRKERERIALVRSKIDAIQRKYNEKIYSCKTSVTLDKINSEIKDLKITVAEYDTLVDSMKQVKSILIEQVKERVVIVKSLEKADAETKKEIIAKVEEAKVEKIQESTIKEQEEEIYSEQRIIILIETLYGEKHQTFKDNKLTEYFGKYGSYKEADAHRDDIMKSEKINIAQAIVYSGLNDDKLKNQRKEIKFKIVDETKIPSMYMKIDETKIRAALSENRELLKTDINSFKIDGVEFYYETTSILK